MIAHEVSAPMKGTRIKAVLADFVELTKPRLTTLSVVTTMSSFYLGTRGAMDLTLFVHTLLGAAMMGAGGAALNQAWEHESDARMRRTSRRPLPAGRLEMRHALWFGGTLSLAAPLYLALAVNLLTGVLSLIALVSYVFVYTPLKTRTPLCTVVGAVPGALPCMMGWTAVRSEIGVEGWILFSILFIWQIPHFLSIAWMYLEEYRDAGLPMLPVVEPDGGSTSRQVIIWCLVLLPISMAPSIVGITGYAYFFEAFFLGLLYLGAAVSMAMLRTRVSARRLLLTSVIYLPLLQAALLVNKA